MTSFSGVIWRYTPSTSNFFDNCHSLLSKGYTEAKLARRTYLDIIRRAERELGIGLLTPEYGLLSILFDIEQTTPLEMSQHFNGSNTSFYKSLKKLEANDVVCAKVVPSDRRRKHYRLSQKALTLFSRQWGRYQENGSEALYADGDPKEVIRKYTNTLWNGLKVRQFTCEGQILLYLNTSPGLANISFRDLVDVSQAKFNTTLVELKNAGHIICERHVSDRRKKLYYVSKRDKAILDEMGSEIFAWFGSKSNLLAAHA